MHKPSHKTKSYFFTAYLGTFHVFFIVFIAIFGSYGNFTSQKPTDSLLYAMFIDLHCMLFLGFGYLMAFLRKYGYSSIAFNFLIASYVLELALVVKGCILMISGKNKTFEIDLTSLVAADLAGISVVISLGTVIGKISLLQLTFMATIEVIVQNINEHIGTHYLQAYDTGEAIYGHTFGAYFGLCVAKIINLKGISHKESEYETSSYQSDIISMLGTLILWIYWPSFNSILAKDEGQMRAIINTYLALTSSCISTFIVSICINKFGKLNMTHIQNATLAGGVAIGAVADLILQPFASMLLGSFAGFISTLGFQYLTPFLNKHLNLHDTCSYFISMSNVILKIHLRWLFNLKLGGVNNLHGIPGILSAISSVVVAIFSSRQNFNGDRLYVFYPSRIPKLNSTEYFDNNLHNSSNTYLRGGGLGRTSLEQGGYQMAALVLTLSLAFASGSLTGFLLKITAVFFKWNEKEEYFNDKTNWLLPQIGECDCLANGHSYSNGNRNFKFNKNNKQESQQINEQNTRL